jgi:TRAP-type C4-dicarboxylate transport system permease small subunit
VGAVVVALTVGLVAWAHHLPYRDRNGGLVSYEVVVACWSVGIAFAVSVATSAAISVTRCLELSARKVQSLSVMAVTLTFFMFAIFVGTLAWTVLESLNAPEFMRQAIGNGLFTNSSSFPPAMVVTVFVMFVGLTAAIIGTVRVAQARRDINVAHEIDGSL